MARSPQLSKADLAEFLGEVEELVHKAHDMSSRAERHWMEVDCSVDELSNYTRTINSAVRALSDLNAMLLARAGMELDRDRLARELRGQLSGRQQS